MTAKLGLLALLEAKPEKGGELAAFLEGGRSIAAAEEGTVTWYAFKISNTSYGIFDTDSRAWEPSMSVAVAHEVKGASPVVAPVVGERLSLGKR